MPPAQNSRQTPKKPTRATKRQPLSPAKLHAIPLEDRVVPATIAGIVFLDYNADGQFDTSQQFIPNIGNPTTSVGVAVDVAWTGPSLTVQAFDANNNVVGATTTNSSGAYSLTVAPGNYRVEFSNVPAGVSLGGTGTSAGTATQFVSLPAAASTATANLGVVRAEDYSPDNPMLVSNIFVYGTFNGANANVPTVMGFNYDAGTGNGDPDSNNYITPTNHTFSITHSQVGATWGLAYNQALNEVYMAAYMKRHAGFGPGGPGAVYRANVPTSGLPAVSVMTTLPTAAVGTNFRTDPAAGLPPAGFPPVPDGDPHFYDGLLVGGQQIGWDSVGKLALGGLDVTPDGRFAFTIGLGDRRLYAIDTATGAFASYALPVPASVTGTSSGNPLGDLRPFAVAYHQGSFYIGAVNSGEATTNGGTTVGDPNSLRAYVFRFTPGASPVAGGTGSFAATPTLDIALNYQRGYIHPEPAVFTVNPGPVSANWNPWSPVYRNLAPTDTNHGIYPQPMLTGLTFNSDGTMTLGLRDRAGDQFGVLTYTDPANNTVVTGAKFGMNGGDTLQAYLTPGGYVLENNGQGPGGTPTSSNGVGNNQGPGGGEFIHEDFLVPGLIPGVQDHQELSVGGVLQLKGFPDVLSTTFDPAQLSQVYNAGGVRWYRNFGAQAGSMAKGYQLYSTGNITVTTPPPTFAKANGIGDLIAVVGTPLEIGNRVWADLNRNGRQDPGEPGINGVSVELYDANNVLLGTATTAGDGEYYFSAAPAPLPPTPPTPGKVYNVNLQPNTQYQVRIPLGQPALAPFGLTTADISGNTEDVRDSDANAIGTIAATTAAVGADHTFDAGFVYRLSIGDYVWDDSNNNGAWDAGEVGISGVTVELLQGATVIRTTTTNASGGYIFNDLNPGQYQVRIPVGGAGQTALVGYNSSSGTNGSLSGPFEPAAPINPGNNLDHGTTQGSFVVGPVIDLQPNAAPTNDAAPPPDGIDALDTATNANSDRTQDFGFFRAVTIGDVVWVDVNNNGLRDAGEAGLPGIVVELLDVGAGNTILASATTNAAGGYLFTYLSPGLYQVRLVRNATLSGYLSSTGSNGAAIGPFEPVAADPANDNDHGTEATGFINGPVINATIGGAPLNEAVTAPTGLPIDPARDADSYRHQDFGVFQPLQLGNFVWEDRNNNGAFDTGETPLGGVPVQLLDANGNVVATTMTNGSGLYLFSNLLPGTYRVRITPPQGYRSSTGVNGAATGPFEPSPQSLIDNSDHGTTTGGTITAEPVTLGLPGDPQNPDAYSDGTANRANLRQDFGLFRPVAIGDLVWEDINNNGRRDSNEPGIGGVTVRLLDPVGNVITTATTASDGGYLFTGLIPGQYRIEVVTPSGYRSSTGTNGSLTGPYEPVSGTPGNSEDHGTISGTVVRGPLVNLDLLAAVVGEGDIPPSTAGDPTPDDSIDRTQDFGFYRPLALGDLVWEDLNNNGVCDAGEPGIAGVTVRLFDGAGNLLGTMVTDATGLYRFDNLAPGQYRVEITPPVGYVSSNGTGDTTQAGSGPYEPAPASNTDCVDNGTTNGGVITGSVITLGLPGTNISENGNADLTEDFGLFRPVVPPPPPVGQAQISGYVYIDYPNVNGLREPGSGERGIPGTRVFLDGRDDLGNRITRVTTTDGNGFYQFTGLPAGTYYVREEQPIGQWIDSLDTPGTVGGATRGTRSNDMLAGIRLNETDAGIEYNFGEIPLATTFGYVWYDINENGIFDRGESPIPGVAVTISGTVLPGTPFERALTSADVAGGLTVRTNSLGRYQFNNLPPGTYVLVETQPQEFDDWMEQNGDPYGAAPSIANDVYTGVVLRGGEIRGPFNYGELLGGISRPPRREPQVPDPSKRLFLGSTSGAGAAAAANQAAALVQTVPGGSYPVLGLPLNPRFALGTGQYTRPTYVVTATGQGTSPLVRVFDYSTGLERFRIAPYENDYVGGVRTAVADVNGDGVADILTATGLGGGPRLRVFDGRDGTTVLHDFFAYEATYTGGLNLAAGDVNGDGFADIITGSDLGGGPRVRVFSGRDGSVLQDYFAFDSAQRGGVRVAVADFNTDGRADIVATTGAGVPTRIRVFDGATQSVMTDFAPYGSGFTGGVFVAAADFNGDGSPDIVSGADAGGGPHVQVFSGLTGTSIASFFAFESTFTGGVRVAAVDLNNDGQAEIVTGAGPGGASRVSVFSGAGVTQVDDFFGFDIDLQGGVYVAGGTTPRVFQDASGDPADAGQLGRPGTLPTLPAI